MEEDGGGCSVLGGGEGTEELSAGWLVCVPAVLVDAVAGLLCEGLDSEAVSLAVAVSPDPEPVSEALAVSLPVAPPPLFAAVGTVESGTVSPGVGLQSLGPSVVVPTPSRSSAIQDSSVPHAGPSQSQQ